MSRATQQLLNLTNAMRESAEQELGEVRKLLSDLAELTIWMTGSADFGPGGQAHEGWVRLKPALDRALAYFEEERRLEADVAGFAPVAEPQP